MKISDYGGIAGIQRAHAPGRPIKLHVIKDGSCPDAPVDLILS